MRDLLAEAGFDERMARLFEALFMPPLNGLLIAALGLLFLRRRAGVARSLFILGPTLILLQMLPIVGGALLGTLQTDAPLQLGKLPSAGAIVVLSAEADPRAPEYGHASIGAMTLQRVRYAAYLARHSKLPVLTSGGFPPEGGTPVAESMRRCLVEEFGVKDVRWVEASSRTTFENARKSAAMLKRAGISSILLVTHAWHMPRARLAFERSGLSVHAAPTAYHGPAYQNPKSLLPSHGGMRATTLALHEILGRIYYAVFE